MSEPSFQLPAMNGALLLDKEIKPYLLYFISNYFRSDIWTMSNEVFTSQSRVLKGCQMLAYEQICNLSVAKFSAFAKSWLRSIKNTAIDTCFKFPMHII